ncbi:MAG: hypothetical protein IKF54_03520 [Eubacterium sp.]|nr:hypothetical protein [Eubacterium sp.]
MKYKLRKIIAVVLAAMMIFSGTVTAFADELPEGEAAAEVIAEEQAREKEEQEKAAEEARKAEEEKAKAQEEQEAKEKAEAEAAAAAKAEAEAKSAPEAEEKAPESSEPVTTVDKEAPAGKQEESVSSAETEDARESSLELNAELSDGTYKPEAVFTGGSGRVEFTCEKVIIKGGEATAVFQVNTDNVTHIYMDKVASRAEDTSLYDPETGKTGEGVETFLDRHVSVPVTLNTDEGVDFSGRTNAMSAASRWIGYTYKLTVLDETQKISDDTTIPENGKSKPEGDDEQGKDDKDDKDDKEPSKKKTLKDGTYKVKATTDRKMFYLYPKEKDPATVILVKKNGKMTATITLTGTGYDYVYMGTPAQAKKAGKKNWIRFKKKSGYYTFKIPVAKLDKKLPITPHSSKYEKDGDPSTDPWRPNKWIRFYSKGAKKVKDGTSIKTKGKASNRNATNNKGNSKGKNDGKAEAQSKYKDDNNKSTGAVNNSTGLKDGVYSPDRFSWSGGSGRLSYIRCNKITVKGGKAFATIEFGSSKYDSLKANGRVYSRGGGGNSTFTIPVKLNANNTIIGRTTAMSQPHWVKYSIFIYKKGAGAGAGKSGKTASEEGDDGHMTSTKKLSSKAPDLMGLEFKEEVEVKYAKYFKIYKYEQDITLIEVDQASDTALYKEEKKKKSEGADDSKAEAADDGSQGTVEYDDEGNIIAQSQNEITDGLYHNNIVNYLIVPEGVEVPAGLDKDCIIIQQPADKTFAASEKVLEMMADLGVTDNVTSVGLEEKDIKVKEIKEAIKAEKTVTAGDLDKPDYAALVKTRTNLALLPSEVLPEEVDEKSTEEEKTESEDTAKRLAVLQKRFSALSVPVLADRQEHEKTNYASAEWIKVYGAIYGKAEEAGKAFDEFVKNNDKKKNQ